ncbi:MAG: xanthine dehydrogenase family protein, partial [Candidatus Dormibacteraeota bacterium]|nr:xanthine dehydrogenase family protein [Candidatus Dormibacteraeota bacterium]
MVLTRLAQLARAQQAADVVGTKGRAVAEAHLGANCTRQVQLRSVLPGVVGQRVRRREDPRFLRGQGQYVDDLRIDGALHASFVRSPLPHARVGRVEVSAVANVPGALAFTAADTDLGVNPAPPFVPVDQRFFRPVLASEKVRFAGDIVAVVLAATPAASADAAELVEVDYDPLPHVVDARDALTDETLLFEDIGTNTCLHHPPDQRDPNLFEGCQVVASGTLVSQRLAACPIEPRATAAAFEDGRLTVWLSTQTPHQDKADLARLLALEPEQIRVVAPDVGGGFGGKGLDVEDVIVAWLARHLRVPVRWTETRSENLIAMHHGRAQRIGFQIGGGRDGRVRALRLEILQDAGAYPGLGAFLPNLTAMMASGVYAIPRIECDVRAVVTNTTPTGPVRGAGRPEATQVLERAIDAFATQVPLDPAEVRRRNFISSEDFPYTTVTGARYDSGDYGRALDLVLEKAGYTRLRQDQARRRRDSAPRQLGIGLSTYVEVTNGVAETEYGAVKITGGGEAIVRTGSLSQGQGHETTFAQIVSERLGLPLERITVHKGDTDVVPRGTGTYGSKSTQIGGAAAADASSELVALAKRLAAAELEASPEDMVFDVREARFHVTGAPQPALSWQELAQRLDARGRLDELETEVDFTAPQPTFPFGAHLAVVEVDTETGQVKL